MNTYTGLMATQLSSMMLRYTPVGLAVFDAQNFCLLEANQAYLALLDAYLDPRWHNGRALGVSITEWGVDNDWGIDVEANGVLPAFRQVAESGEPYRSSEFAFLTAKQGTTYWNWAVDPVQDEEGHITHLIHTTSEITEQVQQRQRMESAQRQLRRENQQVEAEKKRLEVVGTIARGVQETLDATRIGNMALEAIRTHFQANTACLHIDKPEQKVMRLLCAHTPPGFERLQRQMSTIPYERMMPLTRLAFSHREPIVVEDLQEAVVSGKAQKNHPIVLSGDRGYICVPLWFGDHFEGTLCATFDHPISLDGVEKSTLIESGVHIAAGLAHARLITQIGREHNRLRSILDQLPEAILIAEVSDGSISYANPAAAQLLGYTLDELVTIPFHHYSHGPSTPPQGTPHLNNQRLPPWNFVVIRALCGETVHSKETLVARPDGKRIITLTSSAPLYADNGIMTGAMIVFQDVTEQKSLEQHKNEFLAIINHELRTPITVIQGFTEILQIKLTQEKNVPLDSLTHYALTSISEQSQHLTRLIDEMLDISRIEQAQFALQCASHDLLQLLRQVIGGQNITTRLHQISLKLEGLSAHDQLFVSIDEKRITQVFNNLISNAIKYSPAGGKIEVGVRIASSSPDEVLIWVKDEGIGIPSGDIAHIFKRFYRSPHLDPSISGFGIGLYLVKEVITHHRGRIWVESTEGKGATFFVTLPLAVTDPQLQAKK
ncbi:MAG: PAS domain S-box protein [Ktedonobacteraceae bacterium]|nr:PAS domain S-box protein [Ktedonobacteraceae bacterium]MBO0790315.1 PAS domain S-box protein [Ktedonobacteraceae bacterium]